MSVLSEEARRRRHEAGVSGPMKRCMECREEMPFDEYCECLKKVSREIRRKAEKRREEEETWKRGS